MTFASRRRPVGAEDRESEVEVLVVFSKDNFGRTCAVDLENSDTACVACRIRCRELLGSLEAEPSNDGIPDRHEAADPRCLLGKNEPRQQFGIGRRSRWKLDRVGIREIRRCVGAGDSGLWRNRYRRWMMLLSRHAFVKCAFPMENTESQEQLAKGTRTEKSRLAHPQLR